MLVTGSSSGIGAGIASRLHQAGASVVIHCSSNRAGAEALAATLGDRVHVVQGDVQRDAERLCLEVIAQFGQLDALVNNAGIQPVKPYLELTQTDISEMLRVNVQGVMELSGAAAKHMKNGAAIVNISSIEGLQPAFNHSHYATSKAAVLMHTRASALELGKHGIRVNAIAPGLIDREGLEEAWQDGVTTLARILSARASGNARGCGRCRFILDLEGGTVDHWRNPGSRWWNAHKSLVVKNEVTYENSKIGNQSRLEHPALWFVWQHHKPDQNRML